jgi:DNA-binding transcriptional LysR family regulator
MVSCPVISDAYRVETQLLRTFAAVARLGSFSAAAVELGYTQAAVSQQIATLENDLKIQLLNRRPVTPTEAGARLLEHAAPILLRLDAARADVARLTQAPAAALTIGLTPLAAVTSGIVTALAALRGQMPRLSVTVQVAPRAATATAVARGNLDLALIDGLAAPNDSLTPFPPLAAIGIAESDIGVVLPPGHPVAHRESVRLSDLADARWIEAPGLAPLSDIRRHSGVDGFRPAFHYDGTDTLTLIALATAAHGLTLLPGKALPPGVSAVAVTTPRLAHRVELVHGTLRKGSPAAVLAALL